MKTSIENLHRSFISNLIKKVSSNLFYHHTLDEILTIPGNSKGYQEVEYT